MRALARIHYDTQSYVERISVPTLVVHSADDEIVPFAHGRKLFSVASEPKAFVKLQGGHNDGFFVSRARYTEALGEFLDVHVPGSGQ